MCMEKDHQADVVERTTTHGDGEALALTCKCSSLGDEDFLCKPVMINGFPLPHCAQILYGYNKLS